MLELATGVFAAGPRSAPMEGWFDDAPFHFPAPSTAGPMSLVVCVWCVCYGLSTIILHHR